MKKVTLLLALVLAFVLVLAACGGSGDKTTTTAPKATTEATTTAATTTATQATTTQAAVTTTQPVVTTTGVVTPPAPETPDENGLYAADRKVLTDLGLDATKYTVLEYTPVLKGYYNSTDGSKYAEIITTADNSKYFWVTTERFSKEELPVGSVITIKEGYQYRPDGWQALDAKNTAKRPDNVTTAAVVVDEAWWTGFNYRCFNVAYVGAKTEITEADLGVLRIYVPVAEEAGEPTIADKIYADIDFLADGTMVDTKDKLTLGVIGTPVIAETDVTHNGTTIKLPTLSANNKNVGTATFKEFTDADTAMAFWNDADGFALEAFYVCRGNDGTSSKVEGVFCATENPGARSGVGIAAAAGNKPYFCLGVTGDAYVSLYSNVATSKTEFVHVVATAIVEDGNLKAAIYVNGVLANETTKKNASIVVTDINKTIFIGGDTNKTAGSVDFPNDDFSVADIKVYGAALTADEVAEVYNGVKADLAAKAPVLSLDFEDLTKLPEGVTVGGPVTSVEGPDGGKAAQFGTDDTTDSYIKIADNANINFTTADEFTIDFWYKLDGTAKGWENIFQKGEKTKGWYGVWNSNGGTGVCWGGDTGNVKIGAIDANVWHRMTIIQKDGLLYTLFDGKRVGTIKAEAFTSTTALYIGGYSDIAANISKFHGAVDNFAVYDYAWDIDFSLMVAEQAADAPKATEAPVFSLTFEDLEAMPEGVTVVGPVASVEGPNGGKAAMFGQGEGNSYVEVADNAAINFKADGEFTIDFWYMIDITVAHSGWENVFQKGDSAGNGWYGVWNSNANNGVCWGGDAGGNSLIGASTDRGVWHHVTVIQKDGQISTYLDGKLVKSFAAKDFTSTTPLYIGGKGQQFKGALANFNVYDYAFTVPTATPAE